MGATDGAVGTTTKIVDHGSPSVRWDLVILGDGYRAGELATYHTDVQNFVDRIRVTPPWDELWCGVNVWRVDVTSTDSGADEPTACGGPGTTPRTFFDATFCSPWGATVLERLLTVDSVRADAAALAAVPLRNHTMVIVNSSKYGGSGGSIATCSTNAQAAEIAIHEIGHSAFGLADEYANGGTAVGIEPTEPNVTFNPNRATNKWRDLVAATTPMPSSCNPGCADCTPPATPAAAGAVGAYEGAKYVKCGAYRPLPSCYMRDYGPFCPVCARVIRQVLAPFLPPESITLSTPSISFGNVPQGLGGVGVTTFRAVVFEVNTCRRLTFRITGLPTGGFGAPPPTSVNVVAGPYTPANYARLWISYTSTVPGATASGSVTVHCDEIDRSWTIPITAATVARPRTEIVLVLDHSGSMEEDAGDRTRKVDKLRESARIFVDAMLPGDGLSLVRFDDTAQRLTNVTDVGALVTGAGRVAALAQINGSGLDPAGGTSIAAGVLAGRSALDDGAAAAAPAYDRRAMVVLTDGVETSLPRLSTVGSSILADTFAIGLGLPYNISVAALQTLTSGHNGYLLVTGALDTSQRNRLTKYFLQILAGITNASVILDPQGTLTPGAEHRIPFVVSEADIGLDTFVLTPAPKAIEFVLETPDGTQIDPFSAPGSGTTEFVQRDGVAFYRLALPAIADPLIASHEGTWNVVLRLSRRGEGLRTSATRGQTAGLPYDVLVHAYSNLTMNVSAVQSGQQPGDGVRVIARLREYDVAVEGRASVWAEIEQPGGATVTRNLAPRPGGDYTTLLKMVAPGIYRIRVRAQGETFYGNRFAREQTVTAIAIPGGDQTPPVGDGPDAADSGPLAELLCCLRRCLARVCRERRP